MMADTPGKKTILLVEDEKDLVTVVKFRLQSHGYEVITANNGIEALEKIKKIDPDLIILDINLPLMGGIEFYRRISTSYGRPKYPVLMLTARGELEEFFKEIEADGFMSKPFEVDGLIKEIERILAGREKPSVFLLDCAENPHSRMIAECLKTERYNVVFADKFSTLKNMAEKDKPAFIIMEYMQEEASGEEFISRIKKEPALAGVPLIVYSYSGFAECRAKSINAGADRYLGKPEKYDIFIKTIKELRQAQQDR